MSLSFFWGEEEMHQPHWRELFLFLFGQIATLLIPLIYVIYYKFYDRERFIRPELSNRFWGMVSILQGLYYLYIGLSSNLVNDSFDQILSWFGFVFGLIGFGAIYLFWSITMRITSDNNQINFQWAFRKNETILWAEIIEINCNDWRNSIEIKLKLGGKRHVSHNWHNAGILLNEALHKNILVCGYDYEERP